jgi:oxalate decarboxylase
LSGCTFVLVFDNGYFSEFGTFSITDWVGHTPPEVLANNFNVPASTFADFPKGEVYIAVGPVPSPLPAIPAPGTKSDPPLTHRYRLLAQAPEVFDGGTMRIASMADFPISSTMTGALFVIHPGGRMTVFGSGGRARTDEFGPLDVGYVPQSFGHYIEHRRHRS